MSIILYYIIRGSQLEASNRGRWVVAYTSWRPLMRRRLLCLTEPFWHRARGSKRWPPSCHFPLPSPKQSSRPYPSCQCRHCASRPGARRCGRGHTPLHRGGQSSYPIHTPHVHVSLAMRIDSFAAVRPWMRIPQLINHPFDRSKSTTGRAR